GGGNSFSGFDGVSVRAGRFVGLAVGRLVVAIGGLLVGRRGRLGQRRGDLNLDLRLFLVARLAVAAAHFLAAHLVVGRRRRTRLALALPFALGVHDPVVVLGVLVQILRRDPVAARLSLPRQRDVALEHLIPVAANLESRAVALEGLRG